MNRPDSLNGRMDHIKPLDDGAAKSISRQLAAALQAEIKRADTLGQVAACSVIELHKIEAERDYLHNELNKRLRLDDLKLIRRQKQKEASFSYKFQTGVGRFFSRLGLVAVRAMEIMAEAPQIDPASGVYLAQIPRNTKS